MIAHTGFLVRARKLAPGSTLPTFKTKRASKTEFSQSDMDAWLPGQLGMQKVSEKKLRKTVRKAQKSTEVHEN
jgi:tRNA (adenine57-N1/adenine58-N1)-methyltransferase